MALYATSVVFTLKLQASKPFAEFEGNWNAEYHWTIDKEGPNEFVDTRNISTKQKMVKVLSQQEPTESRRLWKDVTEVMQFSSYPFQKFSESQNQRY